MLRLLLMSFLVMLFAIPLLVRLEADILKHPAKLVAYIGLIGAVTVYVRNHKQRTVSATIFEDRGVEPFALLRLSGD